MTSTEQRPRRSRRLGDLGFALDRHLIRVQRDYLGDAAWAKATLAKLRRGLGKPAGSVPEIWDITIGAVPESLCWDGDAPSRAEQAAHAAFVLYALHQQSSRTGVHVPGTSFGSAVGRLRHADDRSGEAVTRRFMAVSTAESVEEALVHMRGLISQLKSAQLGFDYAALADDLLNLLTPGRASRVRLAWGRDFYRTAPEGAESGSTDDGEE